MCVLLFNAMLTRYPKRQLCILMYESYSKNIQMLPQWPVLVSSVSLQWQTVFPVPLQ